MRLLLVRHGRTPHNVARLLDTAHPGADLDEVGLEQAAGLVERLARHDIDAIYVSDLVRTQQTAGPLATARRLTPLVRQGLREVQAGQHEMAADWSGYVSVLYGWRDDPLQRMPGGETAVEVLDRVDEVLAEAADAAYRSIVVVTHGALISVWTAARASNLTPDFLAGVSRDNTVVVELDGHPATGWRVLRWGDQVPPEAVGD
ncbi:MAG TPA: histidine phosphatase family protein [Dermatophilaceae bacterium]|nr:histidine phosphatase family protein [Dermatophilaceae bacterium]